MKPLRLLLVDDHFMVRMGLSQSLSQEPGIEVVGEAGTAAEALAAWERLHPDLVLMDGQLPDGHGVEATREILERAPEAHVLLLSVDETEEDVHQALDAGALGYLPKTVAREELIQAVQTVAAGERYLPEALEQRLARREARPLLSEREKEVLQLVARGLANKQIAAQLELAEITVKVHVSKILEKLGAPDRTRATTIAIERGIVRL